ncbi:exosortase-associated EpsI family protein [Luteolibacter sp. AS25]|uniref:exosortase-associated EpsI family protein n=1 Tax=Luteolibacter sp. AS25 TaxID=3135776 RepID=UPI00398A73C7
MKKWPLLLLPFVVGGSLGSIYFLPQARETRESAISMELPASSEEWVLKGRPPSQDEIGALGEETQFAKAICLRARPGEFSVEGYAIPDRIDLSIVLSGKDMNTSIHRPERCLPAQGHLIKNSSPITIQIPNGKEVTVQRLKSTQLIKDPETGEVTDELDCLTYYFFVGHDRVTNAHLERTLIDMEDRLIKGADQRWAYVSTSMWYGEMPWIDEVVTEKEADAKLASFISGLVEKQIDWAQIKAGS